MCCSGRPPAALCQSSDAELAPVEATPRTLGAKKGAEGLEQVPRGTTRLVKGPENRAGEEWQGELGCMEARAAGLVSPAEAGQDTAGRSGERQALWGTGLFLWL